MSWQRARLEWIATHRFNGRDRNATKWALEEIERLNGLVQVLHTANGVLATIIAKRQNESVQAANADGASGGDKAVAV